MDKKNTIKGGILNPPAGVASRIWKEVRKLINAMIEEYSTQLKLFFSANRSAKAADIMLSNLAVKFDKQFEFAGYKWAADLVDAAGMASEVQLRLSLKEAAAQITLPTTSLQSGKMHDIMTALTQESAELFRTIAPKFHNDVQAAVMQSIVNGKGYKDLKPFFEAHSDGTRNYAHLRTMDQTRKAFNGLAQSRMESVGIEEFEWIHTGGGAHPRKLHQELNGKVFRFDNPPFVGVMYGVDVYGMPGLLPNCRCRFRPVILKIDEK